MGCSIDGKEKVLQSPMHSKKWSQTKQNMGRLRQQDLLHIKVVMVAWKWYSTLSEGKCIVAKRFCTPWKIKFTSIWLFYKLIHHRHD